MRIHSRVTTAVVGTLLLVSVVCGCKKGSVSAGENPAAQSQARFTCPMHPQVLSEKQIAVRSVVCISSKLAPTAHHFLLVILADRTTVQVAPETAN